MESENQKKLNTAKQNMINKVYYISLNEKKSKTKFNAKIVLHNLKI